MAIELGLSRITKLLSHIGNPHESLRVLHVAGTNGKGSVCSYLSTLLQYPHHVNNHSESPNRVGRFTTPHLIHMTDSITINNKPITQLEFDSIKTTLDKVNQEHSIKCSEFEILTCLALSYFEKSRCNWCVLEVGLGGRLDATNVVPGINKFACGITKIGLDHESFLGNTLPQIAFEKAGIITPGVKLTVIDGTNDPSVLDVVKEQCAKVGSELKITDPCVHNNTVETQSWGNVHPEKLPLNGEYQIFNLRIALGILDRLQRDNAIKLTKDDLTQGLKTIIWPGRLQALDFYYSSGKFLPVLMDGAHNGSAAIELAKYIKSQYQDQPVTYIMAVTSGKNLKPLFDPLLRPQDRVYVTRFGAVEGMPWIHANDPNELAEYIKEKYSSNVTVQPDFHAVFPVLASLPEQEKQPVVICGSLYLCGELLKLHNSNTQNV